MSEKFITIKENIKIENTIKKSKFISILKKINSEEEAKNFINEYKKKYYDATHVCSAFVFGEKNQILRSNDDEEPSGTAGKPMLEILIKNNIKNVCAIVIRYFGGIKLGTGGLVRAYSGGIIEALKLSTLVERKKAFIYNFEIPYSLNGKIEYELKKTNFILKDTIFTDKINYVIYVIAEEKKIFLNWLIEKTNNNFQIISCKEKELEFDIK